MTFSQIFLQKNIYWRSLSCHLHNFHQKQSKNLANFHIFPHISIQQWVQTIIQIINFNNILSLNSSVMEDLERIKMQNKSLQQELLSLKNIHEITLLQLNQARENEQKYKQLNDTLIQNIQNNQLDLEKLKNINLVIQGSFGCSHCALLESQLDKYRTGVNESVERRVKEIARNLTDLDEQDNKKSRLSTGKKNNFLINFNKKGKECQQCKQLSVLIDKSNSTIDQANFQIKQLDQQRDILHQKLHNIQSLVSNLKKQNELLQAEISRLLNNNEQNRYTQNQVHQEMPSCHYSGYLIEPKTQSSYKQRNSRPVVSQHKKEERMMREITNIISCLSTKDSEESRAKPRVSNLRDSSALFSIKNGINRPQKNYYCE